MIFKIICTAQEVIRSKNHNSSMIRAKDSLNNCYCRFCGICRQRQSSSTSKIIFTALEVIMSKNQHLKLEKWQFYRCFGRIYRQWWTNRIFKIICTKGSQVGLLWLFAQHEKLLCPKTNTLAWSEPKLEKWRLYRHFCRINPHFVRIYRLWQTNRIFKIICTAWEVIVSKNQNFSMIRTKVRKMAVSTLFWRSTSPITGKYDF